jgi:hypothetical protein
MEDFDDMTKEGVIVKVVVVVVVERGVNRNYVEVWL